MSIKAKDNMKIVVYDTIEDSRPVKKITMEHAEILTGSFRDFIGTVNPKGTLIRKITVAVPLSLVDYLKDNGIPVGRWVPDGVSDDEIDDFDALVTVKINYSYYKEPYIETKVGADGNLTKITESSIHTLQNSQFDDALIIGRLRNGVYMNKPYTSIYLDRATLVLHKEELNPIEEQALKEFGSSMMPGSVMPDEEELPFT